MVYIEEAHASDVWQLPVNIKQDVVYAAPKTAEERAALAQACVRNLKIDIPAIVDSFDNSTERNYTGWPDRLYLIDREGRVAYKSHPGPWGFHPDELEKTLAQAVK